jgi:hypothetical protein
LLPTQIGCTKPAGLHEEEDEAAADEEAEEAEEEEKKKVTLLPALIHMTIGKLTELLTASRLWSYCIVLSYLLQKPCCISFSVLGKKKNDPRVKNKLSFSKSFISIQFLNPVSLQRSLVSLKLDYSISVLQKVRGCTFSIPCSV